MADTYFQTGPTSYGVVDDPANVPGGATIITLGAYNALVAATAAAEADTAIVDKLTQHPALGRVVFTWDDGWDGHPQVAAMHAARGQKATFYITQNLLGTAQHMPASAMKPMLGQGHEIGCHSADHIDMTTLTPVTRAAQWAAGPALEGIIGLGYRIRSYAYPLGNNNLATNSEAYGRFERVATIGVSQGFYTGANGYAPWLYDAGYEGFRHGRFPWSQTTHAQLMRLLDHVRRRPVTLTVYAHQIGNPDTPTLAQVTEAMDYCKANGIPCLTTAEALPGPKVSNPGFELSTDGWVTTLVGAAIGTTTIDTVTDAPDAGLPGTKSLRIISPNTLTNADSVAIEQFVPAEPNRAYSLSARIRHDAPITVSGSGRLSVRLAEYNALGAQVRAPLRGNPASLVTWGQSTVTPTATDIVATLAGKTHPDTRQVRIGLYLQEAAGTFYADHVYFGPTEEGLLG